MNQNDPDKQLDDLQYWPIFKEESDCTKFWSNGTVKIHEKQILLQNIMNRIGTSKLEAKSYSFTLNTDGTLYYQLPKKNNIKGHTMINLNTFIKIVELKCDTLQVNKQSIFIKAIRIRRSKNKQYYLWNNEDSLTIKWYNALTNFAVTSNFDQFYNLGDQIGHGGFSNVFSISQTISEGKQEKFAAKVYSKDLLIRKGQIKKIHEFIKTECEILRTVQSEYIMQIREIVQLNDVVILISELITEGTLYNLLKRIKKIDQLTAAMIILQIAKGLKVLHCHNFVHRDLKLENVMIVSLDPIKIKIIDFGFGEKINRQKLNSGQGTAGYIPPEVFKSQPYTEKSDLFSLGIIYYSLITGTSAFKAKNYQNLQQANKLCQIDFSQQLWTTINQKTKKIIYTLTLTDPNQRYDVNQLISELKNLIIILKDQPIQTSEVYQQVDYFIFPIIIYRVNKVYHIALINFLSRKIRQIHFIKIMTSMIHFNQQRLMNILIQQKEDPSKTQNFIIIKKDKNLQMNCKIIKNKDQKIYLKRFTKLFKNHIVKQLQMKSFRFYENHLPKNKQNVVQIKKYLIEALFVETTNDFNLNQEDEEQPIDEKHIAQLTYSHNYFNKMKLIQ